MNYVPYAQQGSSADPAAIVVFGCTGVGKTTFVNDASRAELGVGHGLASSTQAVQTSPVFQLNGRNVILYDTPGFDDTMMTDTQILTRIADFLEGMYNTGKKITGLLYFHRITDNRMTGASVRSFDLFTKMCGLSSMRNVMIVTNMWSDPADPEEDRRFEQLGTSFFNIALENGAKMSRRAGVGPQSAQAILQTVVNLQSVNLQLQVELARGLQLDETQAGMLVDQNLRVRLERQRREKEELEEELEAARQDRDRRAQEQLERYKRDREEEERILREQIEALKNARRALAGSTRHPGASHGLEGSNPDHPDQPDRNGGRGFSKWTPKIFQANARQGGGRGREPRSATSSSRNRSSQTENRKQGRTSSATPSRSRNGGFRLRGRIKMMYWRRSRSETGQ